MHASVPRAAPQWLDGAIPAGHACDGMVLLDADALACGRDWHAVDATHVELLGDACAHFMTGAPTLTATFPCGTDG